MAKLVIQGGPEAGREIPLAGPVVLGREGPTAIGDTKLSRQHASVTADGGGHIVTDLDSRNGTTVNGAKIKRQALRHGDLIQVGNTSLRFLADARATAAAAPTDSKERPAPPPRAEPRPPPRPAAGRLIPDPAAALGEDLSQRNFTYKAGMVLLALGAAAALFYGVAALSEKLFE